jgi:thiosulfate/3-mercaptopyruvate sulfurtransferase
MSEYVHPEVLVTTEWVASHTNDPKVRIVEVDVDTKAYDEGHIPNALGWAWNTQLCDTVRRDIIPQTQLESLMESSGIGNETTIALYGDNNNWFAAWAFWQLKVYGHADVRIMNGGRKKWISEGRDLSQEVPKFTSTGYKASKPDYSIRAFLPDIQEAIQKGAAALVDVRSPQEFTGEILAPPGLPETCQRGGHLPGARSITWSKTCNDDGTFKSFADLKSLYEKEGINGTKPIIAYCRIGERSSHSWFVLKFLLGYKDVKNYDGSWTEWGNLVGVPVEKGTVASASA